MLTVPQLQEKCSWICDFREHIFQLQKFKETLELLPTKKKINKIKMKKRLRWQLVSTMMFHFIMLHLCTVWMDILFIFYIIFLYSLFIYIFLHNIWTIYSNMLATFLPYFCIYIYVCTNGFEGGENFLSSVNLYIPYSSQYH